MRCCQRWRVSLSPLWKNDSDLGGNTHLSMYTQQSWVFAKKRWGKGGPFWRLVPLPFWPPSPTRGKKKESNIWSRLCRKGRILLKRVGQTLQKKPLRTEHGRIQIEIILSIPLLKLREEQRNSDSTAWISLSKTALEKTLPLPYGYLYCYEVAWFPFPWATTWA